MPADQTILCSSYNWTATNYCSVAVKTISAGQLQLTSFDLLLINQVVNWCDRKETGSLTILLN